MLLGQVARNQFMAGRSDETFEENQRLHSENINLRDQLREITQTITGKEIVISQLLSLKEILRKTNEDKSVEFSQYQASLQLSKSVLREKKELIQTQKGEIKELKRKLSHFEVDIGVVA
jgi:hypothetical protein